MDDETYCASLILNGLVTAITGIIFWGLAKILGIADPKSVLIWIGVVGVHISYCVSVIENIQIGEGE